MTHDLVFKARTLKIQDSRACASWFIPTPLNNLQRFGESQRGYQMISEHTCRYLCGIFNFFFCQQQKSFKMLIISRNLRQTVRKSPVDLCIGCGSDTGCCKGHVRSLGEEVVFQLDPTTNYPPGSWFSKELREVDGVSHLFFFSVLLI